jgi:hypothetical protein
MNSARSLAKNQSSTAFSKDQLEDETTSICDSDEDARIMSKRRKGYPSETNVKRGSRGVTINLKGETGSTPHFKEFIEKLGRKDLCPCGSQKRF